jgi:hypothetical protein
VILILSSEDEGWLTSHACAPTPARFVLFGLDSIVDLHSDRIVLSLEADSDKRTSPRHRVMLDE